MRHGRWPSQVSTSMPGTVAYLLCGCRRLYCCRDTAVITAVISTYIMVRVFERTGIWPGVISSRPQYGILGTGISRSNRFVRAPYSRGRLQRPTLWLIRSAPWREREWGLSETSEKCAIFCVFERYSPDILRILMYGEVDEITLGKTLFPNWLHTLS